MRIKLIPAFVCVLLAMQAWAQQVTISGRLADAFTEVSLPLVKVSIDGLPVETLSRSDGSFLLEFDPGFSAEVILRMDKTGYILKRLPVRTALESKELGVIYLQPDPAFEMRQQNIISLTEAELLEAVSELDNISGILQSSRDVFLNAASFDFSQTFFRPRGLGAEYGKLLINGIEMNKYSDGRPQWSNWGGLNDVQRNQVFSNGISPNDYQFGGLGGTTNIIMRASKYQKGGRINLAASNRSYTGRIMATYASGEESNGWYYALSVGRRFAEEAYMDGTLYDANSFFLSVEKKLNENHALNFSGMYTPNTRGRSAPMTQEVFDLKGRTYNPYWGLQNDEIRNSRMRTIKEPVLMLNHNWNISETIDLSTNLAYQFGEVANSRIDYGGTTAYELNGHLAFIGGGQNPDPVYYQKLPSYFLRFEDSQNFESAFRAQKSIKATGQFDWNTLYQANRTAAENGLNSIYALSEDVNQDKQISFSSILNWKLGDRFILNSSLRANRLQSHHFARINDLFGGQAFLDIDSFVQDEPGEESGLAAQSDLLNLNRLVGEGDTYKYNYEISARDAEFFSQVQYQGRKMDLYLAGRLGMLNYSRTGYYQNGVYPDNSLGDSLSADFFNYGLKGGGVYKFSGKHNLELNAAHFSKAPAFRNVFINPRQNDFLVPGISEEIINTGDLSFRYRNTEVNFRVTGYFSQINNSTEVSYYFAEGLSGLERENTTAFVQEVLTGLDRLNYGLELGGETYVTESITLKAVLSLGEYLYASNPNVLVSSAGLSETINYGRASLKNYHVPGGPQTAGQIAFEYRDRDFWWFATSLNYFSRAFIDINPLTRTTNFQLDYDGLPLNEYDSEVARALLRQEQFDDYFLVNAVGGKSWRINGNYLGTFFSLNNIFNVLYKSGGFEQGRNANYRSLKTDKDRDMPLFAPKYWYGQGTSFFANVYFRF
ncbi:TonB-dependent receptor [Gramella sp. BOM4]|nr:TonB-dependent receptor [Christiangramia bathymodioli]